MAGWKARKHTAVHQPRWLLHARWGVDHTPVHTTELKTQTAQRGWGTDGWKPTTAKAADTFTARDIGRIGQEHQGQGIGPSKDTKHIKPRGSQGCMHTCRETEVGISSLQPHSQHHTSQPRWWPSRNSSRRAGSSSMLGGYAGSDGRCVTTQATNRCRQREAINASAAWDWGNAQVTSAAL